MLNGLTFLSSWTLLTACFSHKDLSHLLINGLGLYLMGPAALGILGNSAFLALYLGGGIVGSLASLFWNNYIKQQPTRSQGASGMSPPHSSAFLVSHSSAMQARSIPSSRLLLALHPPHNSTSSVSCRYQRGSVSEDCSSGIARAPCRTR